MDFRYVHHFQFLKFLRPHQIHAAFNTSPRNVQGESFLARIGEIATQKQCEIRPSNSTELLFDISQTIDLECFAEKTVHQRSMESTNHSLSNLDCNNSSFTLRIALAT